MLTEQEAIAEIKRHGASVEVAETGSQTPGMTVSFRNCAVTAVDLEHLECLTNLQVLDLGATQLADADLQRLGRLIGLRRLALDETHVTDAGLQHLKGLVRLEELWLFGTPVTDAGLQHLQGLTSLRRLDLSYGQIAGPGLQHLTGLASLRELRLGHTQVTNRGLQHLKALSHLQELHLGCTDVTDAGLEYLKDLSGLQSLDLHDTKVTDQAVNSLQKQLPNLNIIRPRADQTPTEPQDSQTITMPRGNSTAPGQVETIRGREASHTLGETKPPRLRGPLAVTGRLAILACLFGIPLACVVWALCAIWQSMSASPGDAEFIMRDMAYVIIPVVVGLILFAIFRGNR